LDNEYALPRIARFLTDNSSRAWLVVPILYAFVPDEPSFHYQVMKHLQEALPHSPATFLRSIAILVWQERQFTDDLIDLYKFYATVGLSSTSPRDRAAAASILCALGNHVPAVVETMIQKVIHISNDTWWEARAQAVMIAAALLRYEHLSDANVVTLRTIVEAGLSSTAPNVTRVGMCISYKIE